ncbi:hypothetical protein FK178_10350 [Antarcticibacterium arcticum]|uniref:TonB C-terminal domain-containing protein n=1 Tax=Antarcticibacterium arcticum TaxID=2585771 RepID=A0A5B8YLJ6_9FLAO|nr:energy transducer TonB [Antarcticibacterium arcticum]QED38098.1 hypothetical protein FK178_10350 [Antarcticibacterium arcticum]
MKIKFLLLSLCLFICSNLQAQTETYTLTEVDNAPVIGDCEEEDPKVCFENNLKTHISTTMKVVNLNSGIGTKAYAQFEISETGKVENIQVRSYDKKLTKETERILKKLKIKEAATKNGKKVKMRHTVPVSFNLIVF